MGCCLTRPESQTTPSNLPEANIVGIGGNKPFSKVGLTYVSESPITRSQLKAQREAFWDTSPSYEGRIEIWQALRAAVEAEDLSTAQAILDSVNVIIPTGHLNEGCYDELGNRYAIPLYCIVDATNLIEESIGNSGEGKICQKGSAIGSKTSLSQGDQIAKYKITLRISSGKDRKLSVSGEETWADVKKTLMDLENLNEKANIRFFFMGKPLLENNKLTELSAKLEMSPVIQVMVSP